MSQIPYGQGEKGLKQMRWRSLFINRYLGIKDGLKF